MDVAEYRRRLGGGDDAASGWDAIDARLGEAYGDQEPRHGGSIIKQVLAGTAIRMKFQRRLGVRRSR